MTTPSSTPSPRVLVVDADGDQVNIPELVEGDECKTLSEIIGFRGLPMRSRK
jgi:hypothetical protein